MNDDHLQVLLAASKKIMGDDTPSQWDPVNVEQDAFALFVKLRADVVTTRNHATFSTWIKDDIGDNHPVMATAVIVTDDEQQTRANYRLAIVSLAAIVARSQ